MMQEYLSAGLGGGSEPSETFVGVVLSTGVVVVDGALPVVVTAVVVVETGTVVVTAVVVVETGIVVDTAGSWLVGVDASSCSVSSSIRSARTSISGESEPPQADPSNNKEIRAVVWRINEISRLELLPVKRTEDRALVVSRAAVESAFHRFNRGIEFMEHRYGWSRRSIYDLGAGAAG